MHTNTLIPTSFPREGGRGATHKLTLLTFAVHCIEAVYYTLQWAGLQWTQFQLFWAPLNTGQFYQPGQEILMEFASNFLVQCSIFWRILVQCSLYIGIYWCSALYIGICWCSAVYIEGRCRSILHTQWLLISGFHSPPTWVAGAS